MKFIKRKLKVLIAIVLSASVTVYAESIIRAKEISFTPSEKNKDWQVNNVEDAINDLYENNSGCTNGIYEYPGGAGTWSIDTGIDFKQFSIYSYTPNINYYITYSYNSNVNNEVYQFIKGSGIAAEIKTSYFSLADKKITYNGKATWGEMVNPGSIYWIACK